METAPKTSAGWKSSFDLILLVLSLSLTFLAWKESQRLVDEQGKRKLLAAVDISESQLNSGIQYYENALFAGKGLFAASQEVERGEFDTFFAGIDIGDRFPGAYSFVYVARVTEDDLAAYEDNFGIDVNLDLANDSEHYIVDYIAYEHPEEPTIFGYDLRLDEVRKQVLEKARDSGNPTAFPPLILKGPEKPGFILTVPVYKNGADISTTEAKREALVGFINETFIYEDFFAGIFPSGAEILDIHIKDGETLFYDSDKGASKIGKTSIAKRAISVGDRNWEVEFFGDPAAQLGQVERELPIVVLASGMLFSLLIFGITYALSGSRKRAQDLAQRMTAELEKEKALVEQKVTERTNELSNEKSKLAASIEALVRAYIMLDKQGQVILTNHKVSDFLGGTEGNWTLAKVQAKFSGLFDITKSYQDCIRLKKRVVSGDILLGAKTFFVEIAPFFTDKDKKELLGALILISDVTEDRVLQRSRDEFFSIASHELRTPLTAIKGNASLIKQFYSKALKDPDMAEMVDDIEESSTRLIDIVNDFLNLGRLEQGRIEFKIEDFDIISMVENALRQYQVTSSRKKLSLNFEKPATSYPKVRGDQDRARQVLINLIGNAFKFTEKGGVSISLKKTDGEVGVYVSDTGLGIPVANQALLFRKFQQAGSSIYTRDTSRGTGLGLYISKLMVEGMAGKVWLEKSEVGKGSTFAFCLRIAKEGGGVDNKT